MIDGSAGRGATRAAVRSATTGLAAAVVAAGIGLGCSGVYVLPDPPGLVATPAAEESGPVEVPDLVRETIAQETIAALADAMASGDHARVWDGLSHETRLLLDHHHPEGGDAALGEGTLWVGERPVSFRPAHLLLVEGLQEARALSREESEAASERRIEVWLEGESESRRVVLIREGNVWRLHAPRLSAERLGGQPPGAEQP